jgi:hypothetical protein
MKLKSRLAAAAVALLLFLLSLAPAPAPIVSGTTGSGGSGNAGSGAGAVGGQFQIWEDFETPSPITMAGLLARRQNSPLSIPDRQPQSKFVWYGTSGNILVSGFNGSNVSTIANGEWSFDVNKAPGFFDSFFGGGGQNLGYHLYASNTVAGGVGLGWSRIHGTFMYTNSGAGNGAELNTTMILGPANCMFSPGAGQEATPQNDFLHIQFDLFGCSVARATSGDYLIRETYPSILAAGVEYDVDFQAVSNSCLLKVGPYIYSGTHSNLSLWSGPLNGVIADWEVFGSPSNQQKHVWKNIGAGFAENWFYALAQGNKAVGTNFQTSARVVYKPTLTTNTYLLNQNDGIVINGSPGTSTTLVTNKLPYLTTTPAATITISDGTTTAAGSNIWILTIDGTKISNGTTQTNIAANNGALTFVATPTGWQIISKN